jgi:hypothetical protein
LLAVGVRVIFKIISGIDIQESTEEHDTATAALDRVRALIVSGLPNIRVLKDGLPCSLAELEGHAEFENEADDF